MGNYVLRPGVTPVTLQPEFLFTETGSTTAPADIIDCIRHDAVRASNRPNDQLPPASSSLLSSVAPTLPLLPSRSTSSNYNIADRASSTIGERAAAIIRSGKITLDSKLVAFTIMGTLEPSGRSTVSRDDKLLPSQRFMLPYKGCSVGYRHPSGSMSSSS
jgi:hypothetical protein